VRVAALAAALLFAVTAAAAPFECASRDADAPPAPDRVALGAYLPAVDRHPGEIDRYTRLMGRGPLIVSTYEQWDARPFVRSELDAVWRRGALPMVTWEPMSYHGRRYPLRAIARGRFDRYVHRAARAAAAWGHPVLLRFAHEMNGRWYPWSAGREGNTPRRYRQVWRRLVRIFRVAGADNVRWVWTPYASPAGRFPFQRFFPGDEWVDWVGLDGFNWGRGRWRSFARVFGTSYQTLARISDRPMIIAETGAFDRGKAGWIRGALGAQLAAMPRIRAVVWFNHPAKGVDLRFSGTRAGLRSFRRAAASPRFGATRAELLAAAGS
jgi:glycosyl hydrolase family 26